MTFTHLDAGHHPAMVDVSDKKPTKRTATAEARVRFPPRSVTRLGWKIAALPSISTATPR